MELYNTDFQVTDRRMMMIKNIQTNYATTSRTTKQLQNGLSKTVIQNEFKTIILNMTKLNKL